jgi:chromatin segregation and condensation protein Rec8/ScpA/Scc1 (kleisin family)
MQSIMETCEWFPSYIEKLRKEWKRKKDHYQPSVSDKVEALLVKFANQRPMQKHKVQVQLDDVRVFETDMGKFLTRISDNWKDDGKRVHTKLTPYQVKSIEETCVWFFAYMKSLRKEWKRKRDTYQPSVRDKVEALLEMFWKERPTFNNKKTQVKLDDFRVFETDMGDFLNSIRGNWKDEGPKKITTKLSPGQMKSIEQTCEWFLPCLESWRGEWKQRSGAYQPSVDDKVEYLLENFVTRRPTSGKKISVKLDDVRIFEVDMGSFVSTISRNWKDDGEKG